ncbi:MAG: hypothetical protein MO852_10670 [Candidatus Devosia euplotis]|nr:hypothetical protein [Candidatus Devosia euplotis]
MKPRRIFRSEAGQILELDQGADVDRQAGVEGPVGGDAGEDGQGADAIAAFAMGDGDDARFAMQGGK